MNPRDLEVEVTLGGGSSGKVFRARGPDGELWVLKVLHPHVISSVDVDHIRNTFEELRGARHPAIPSKLALLDFRGDLVVAHEYREAVDLDTLANGGRMPVRAALELCAEIADALEAARLAPDKVGDPLGIRHGDIKPSNVLVSPVGQLTLVDFGMSKVRQDAKERTLTMFHDSRGFMSPERVDNQSSDRCDLYSVALLFFFLVTGERPSRTSANKERHITRNEHIVQRVAAAAANGEARAVKDLIAQTLSYRPSERPQIREFRDICREIAAKTDGTRLVDWAKTIVTAFRTTTEDARFLDDGGRLSLAGKTPMHPGPRGQEPTPAPVLRQPQPQPRRNLWIPLILLLLLVGAVAVIGAYALAG